MSQGVVWHGAGAVCASDELQRALWAEAGEGGFLLPLRILWLLRHRPTRRSLWRGHGGPLSRLPTIRSQAATTRRPRVHRVDDRGRAPPSTVVIPRKASH